MRFSAIPGRSIRAGPIWPQNLVRPDDFGEKWTIYRFRFGQLRWMCASLPHLDVISVDLWSITLERTARVDQASGFRENAMNFKVSL